MCIRDRGLMDAQAQNVLGLFNWQVLMRGSHLSLGNFQDWQKPSGNNPLSPFVSEFCVWSNQFLYQLNFKRVMLGYPHAVEKVKTWLFPPSPWVDEAV